jgi:hypothetical protein
MAQSEEPKKSSPLIVGVLLIAGIYFLTTKFLKAIG